MPKPQDALNDHHEAYIRLYAAALHAERLRYAFEPGIDDQSARVDIAFRAKMLADAAWGTLFPEG